MNRDDIIRMAAAKAEPQCNPHPEAPHGFLRNASHTEGRYVCACEFWTAPVEPVQEPIPLNDGRLWQYPDGRIGVGTTPQRKPLTEEEIDAIPCTDGPRIRLGRAGAVCPRHRAGTRHRR